jgi:hypothetical protein
MLLRHRQRPEGGIGGAFSKTEILRRSCSGLSKPASAGTRFLGNVLETLFSGNRSERRKHHEATFLTCSSGRKSAQYLRSHGRTAQSEPTHIGCYCESLDISSEQLPGSLSLIMSTDRRSSMRPPPEAPQLEKTPGLGFALFNKREDRKLWQSRDASYVHRCAAMGTWW